MRMAGSVILLLLPEPGLDEALESLREVWEFRSEQLELGPPAPLQEDLVESRVIESSERSLLTIED